MSTPSFPRRDVLPDRVGSIERDPTPPDPEATGPSQRSWSAFSGRDRSSRAYSHERWSCFRRTFCINTLNNRAAAWSDTGEDVVDGGLGGNDGALQ